MSVVEAAGVRVRLEKVYANIVWFGLNVCVYSPSFSVNVKVYYLASLGFVTFIIYTNAYM